MIGKEWVGMGKGVLVVDSRANGEDSYKYEVGGQLAPKITVI